MQFSVYALIVDVINIHSFVKNKNMDFLKSLHIQPVNLGVSTGNKWLPASREKITSFSPVDGKEISTVSICDKKSYDLVITTSQKAFIEWRQ